MQVKSHQFFCGDNPNNYNIEGNVDLKMLIHDKLFLLISQLEKKSYNFSHRCKIVHAISTMTRSIKIWNVTWQDHVNANK